jgi:hypothetical protein
VSSYPYGMTEAQQAYLAIEELDDKSVDNVYRNVQPYGPLAVAAAAAATSVGQIPGGGGGANSLADLDDVGGTPGPGKSPVGNPTGTDFLLTQVVTQTDLDAILAAVAAVDWRVLDLQPGFAPFGDGFADPRYRLTLNNVVHLEGMVGCNPPLAEDDVGKLVCTLPSDSYPSGRLLFGCPAFGNNARFDVDPNGAITFEGMLMGGGQIDWFSLTPITFSVGAAS